MSKHKKLIDKLVTFVAPRSPLDFVGKVLFLTMITGGLNFARDLIGNGLEADGFLNNTMEAAVVGLPFSILGFALIGRLNQLQGDLVKLATIDLLTGLYNRRAFYERVADFTPNGEGVLMMIDADHFKKINDTYGHGVRDLCLKALADHLRQSIRNNDIVARIGGEEFAVVLLDVDPDQAHEIGERIAQGVSLNVDEGVVRVTMSIGASLLNRKTNFDESLRRADAALYVAKVEGRARMVMPALA